jgi:predicted glycogen debranching enzyme
MSATRPIRTQRFETGDADPSFEWLVTNGIGGYASGPVRGGLSRRYHGLLIASLPVPAGRLMCLNLLRVTAIDRARTVVVDHENLAPPGDTRARLTEFTLENGLPLWRYDLGDHVSLEKRVVMPYGRNTTHVFFRLEAPAPITLRLVPAFQVRGHEQSVAEDPPAPHSMRVVDHTVDLAFGALPTVHWRTLGEEVRIDRSHGERLPVQYAIERARGYDYEGHLLACAGIELTLAPNATATFTISTESIETLDAVTPADALTTEHSRRDRLLDTAGLPADRIVAELTLAADQFVIAPVGRAEEVARARAAGDEPRSVIAGYHWFTDWGRDTMISLEGLTLATGRWAEAGCILRTFGHYVRDGLIPNMFPEGAQRGLYHTADATLWFFHALDRYVTVSHDHATLTALLPKLVEIAECHMRGTSFGIGVDPADGLLREGAEGYQLTWMDAKVGDWVVTPRRGKAVEINALWYNALRLLSHWLTSAGRSAEAREWNEAADRVFTSFNNRFWNPDTTYLYDVVDGEDGNDPACRPNQVFAISLAYPVLDPARWPLVLTAVRSALLTPLGLRTLSRKHPDYRATYDGDLRSRDAAYHQGTVWAWLIGPFIDAWRRAYPDDEVSPRSFLAAFTGELGASGLGTISEIFDAEPPHTAGGCIAQAWSVAEVLRTWRALAHTPHPNPDAPHGH